MNYQLSVPQVLEQAYLQSPEKEVIFDGYKRVTYEELYQSVQLMASALASKGIQKGDRVLVCLPNWHEFVTIYFGLAQIGAILVPCNTRYMKEELQFILENSGAKAIFLAEEYGHFEFLKPILNKDGNFQHIFTVRFKDPECTSYEELLELGKKSEPPQVEIDSIEDVFSILYTSGTTGHPKGAMLTHKNFVHTATVSAECMNCTSNDVFLIAVPVFHCFGMIPGILTAIVVGGKMVFMEEFKAEKALTLIEQEKISVHHGVPTMFILELNHPSFKQFDLSSLRTGIIAAAPCPEEIVRKIRTIMGCDIVVSYGMTESSTTLTITGFEDDDFLRSETVGKAAPGAEVKIVDNNRVELSPGVVGEIAAKSFGIMKGYFNSPEKTAEALDQDGWYYTGDLGTLDENGYLRIIGRKKEMIIRGGFNIYPREIEEILYKHESVLEVAIVGLPDTVLGEITCAAIRLKPGKTEDQYSMKTYLKDKVADFKIPDHFIFVEKLPVTASGKIKKIALEQELKETLKPLLR
ncbi:long-chain-fatty-acid--CoA ligase [Schinkia azotoformans]|uniref:AMP-dependent synthetase and ligase n=1 Tax=Schinkia azotoformans LMG 9581 TaxID=1131731 RepID=K6E4I0_SCHAZ|nr:long-chain-fatty-acid--CoA ligase [Schinkia azotoformans]EKN68146.1 AMP-dependent synthetase and ligase [Schinkia azotoformans LMG 9581]MEC1638044.1 long-chain-fatty-acid--CoA ligase [Schinkia azotoformans]MEC1946522.1 long-chain-fatty-acid--CoA ligase [Schinkia azotoformans]MED4351992.1 long-chain-fatty-acid--CoA ligase [Schinkia azotoformans]